jgi:hypothetical protein
MKHIDLKAPESEFKKLLLLDHKREKLYCKDGNLIEVEFSQDDRLTVYQVSITKRVKRMAVGVMSLQELGIKYLGLEDPSEILQHLILPVMEIERIFNSIRYKWVKTILGGKREPKEYINASFNPLFKALAGFPLRNDPGRRQAMKLVAEEGFKVEDLPIIDLSVEKHEMGLIITYLFDVFSNDLSRLYKSLLSIKPAFHERYMDFYYFDYAHLEGLEDSLRDDRRTRVLQEIHGLRKPQAVKDLNTISREIMVPHFITYATCAIVEGPAAYRLRLDVSYYEQLRKGESNLQDHFLIFDYFGRPITEMDLNMMKRFQYHRCLD